MLYHSRCSRNYLLNEKVTCHSFVILYKHTNHPPPFQLLSCTVPNFLSAWILIAFILLTHVFFFFFLRFYLFIFRERGREGERERNINVWLPLTRPPLRTLPATQACALTGNRTGDSLVLRPELNPLSHTSQGC